MTLPVDVHSPDQLSEVLIELRGYITAVRETAIRQKVGVGTRTPQLSTPLKQLLDAANIDITDVTQLEALAAELEMMLAKLPVVHIMMAALPSRVIRRQITLWFRAEIHPSTLITFSARSDIGGGAIVHAGSRIYDLSFKKQILTNKHRITELAGV